LKDSYKVYFTPVSETCTKTRQRVDAAKQMLKKALPMLADIKDTEDFKARTAMLKPFQKTKMLHDKMGCEVNGVPILETKALEDMLGKLRKAFIKTRDPDIGKEIAGQRFDKALQFMKDHSNDTTLKDAVGAAGIFLGTDVNTDESDDGLDGDEAPEGEDQLEDRLENVLAEKSTNVTASLMQLYEARGLNSSQSGSHRRLLYAAMIIACFALVWFLPFWIFVGALAVAAGFIAISELVKWRKQRRSAAVEVVLGDPFLNRSDETYIAIAEGVPVYDTVYDRRYQA